MERIYARTWNRQLNHATERSAGEPGHLSQHTPAPMVHSKRPRAHEISLAAPLVTIENCGMPKQSAGLLLHRLRGRELEVFLVHPGGPFWAKKDAGAWTIPKGEFTDGEDPLTAAKRELREETGVAVEGPFSPLGTVRQAGGKLIHGWIAAGDFDADAIVSNTFKMIWPPRSGKWSEFPEVDRAGWFSLTVAAEKINPAQAEFLHRLRAALDAATT